MLFGDSADTSNATVSGITLGGAADNWAQSASHSTGGHANVEGWADPNCAGGQTSVVVSTTGGSGSHMFAWVFEWSGLTGTLDASSGGDNGFAGTWTSGISGATVQASEVAFGITCGAVNGVSGTAEGLAGPSAPWVNEAAQSLNGSSHTKAALCGYQILSSTGTVTYSGTASPINTNDTVVFTLEAAAAGNATVNGAVAALALAAVAGTVTADATITGVVSALTLAAPAGTATSNAVVVSGPVAALTLTAPAGGTGQVPAALPLNLDHNGIFQPGQSPQGPALGSRYIR
jgi:hypothetical protein